MILERAGAGETPACECMGECGRPHGPDRCMAFDGLAHPETGSRVVLTIAHLDHQPEHCDPENLRAMCQACHLAFDADHHREQRYRNERAELEAAGQGTLFGGIDLARGEDLTVYREVGPAAGSGRAEPTGERDPATAPGPRRR